jgi:hypothetical protein
MYACPPPAWFVYFSRIYSYLFRLEEFSLGYALVVPVWHNIDVHQIKELEKVSNRFMD